MAYFQARHTYICDYHKNMIQCARTKQRRLKDSEDDSNEAEMDSPEVDWFQLQVPTLRRYKRHYKVPTRPGWNKTQLAEVSSGDLFFFLITYSSWDIYKFMIITKNLHLSGYSEAL